MAATGIYFVGALLLCLCACAWAAPSVSDLEQFGELERTLKDLATSVLAMNGGTAGAGESGMTDVNARDLESDMDWESDGATILEYLNKLSL